MGTQCMPILGDSASPISSSCSQIQLDYVLSKLVFCKPVCETMKRSKRSKGGHDPVYENFFNKHPLSISTESTADTADGGLVTSSSSYVSLGFGRRKRSLSKS